ncbi:MAG: hypothetical protein RSD01_08615 [Ruthenibacterium sp.]
MKNSEFVLGVTDGGLPIVMPNGTCEHWQHSALPVLSNIKECWYCHWADFRKTTDLSLEKSICRCPENAVKVQCGNKNETVR